MQVSALHAAPPACLRRTAACAEFFPFIRAAELKEEQRTARPPKYVSLGDRHLQSGDVTRTTGAAHDEREESESQEACSEAGGALC